MNATLFESVVRHFDQHGLKYEKVEGRTRLHVGFASPHGGLRCMVDVDEPRGIVLLRALLPTSAPEEKRHAVAEFITRVNYGLIVGNFEMDYRDGEIAYKTSVCMADEPFSPDLMMPLVGFAVATATRYMPAVSAVLFGGTSAADAAAMAEGRSEPARGIVDRIRRMLGDTEQRKTDAA